MKFTETQRHEIRARFCDRVANKLSECNTRGELAARAAEANDLAWAVSAHENDNLLYTDLGKIVDKIYAEVEAAIEWSECEHAFSVALDLIRQF